MSYPIPTPETDSYGTVTGVEAYVGVYTDDGVFNMTTVPTNLTVIHWIDQVSDMFNVALATSGFRTPITQEDAAAAIGMAVEQLVADLAHYANSKGRFLAKGFQEKGGSVMGQVWKEIEDWVEAHSIGFINLGVPRVTGTLGVIGSKGIDASGESITPIFQRKGFGNKFTDWTSNG